MNREFMKQPKVLFSAAVVAFFCASLNVQAAAGVADQQINENVNHEEAKVVTAGVTADLCQEIKEKNNPTAGVSASLVDFELDELELEQEERQVVASAKEDGEAAAAKDNGDGSFCGYNNLGIANVSSCLNVRKEPTTESEIVGKMMKKNACEILSVDGEWAKIKSGKVDGYVKTEYLLTGEEARKAAEGEVMTYAVVNTDTLRVREKDSTESKVVSLVGSGEELPVVKSDKEWAKVEVDNEKGYVSKEYVKLKEKLPVAESVKELKKGEGVNDTRVKLVSTALSYVGNRYVWGGTSLTNGVDCSGFTMRIYEKFGISLSHASTAQPGQGKKIKQSEARPGDLFFYGNGRRINHVAIYIGNGQIVHASNPRNGIKVSNANYRKPVCVCSYLN